MTLWRGCALAVMTSWTVGSAAPHDIHTSHTRAVVEGAAVLWKVRLFSDDLEKGLRAFSRRPSLVLAKDPASDSIFTTYFNTRVGVSADGVKLSAHLVDTGTDRDPVGGTVHWYLLQFDAARPPTTLSITNNLLAEQFANQANSVVLLAMPGETRHSLYFGEGDRGAQQVRLRR